MNIIADGASVSVLQVGGFFEIRIVDAQRGEVHVVSVFDLSVAQALARGCWAAMRQMEEDDARNEKWRREQ
jgi:hypothetical protein